MAADIQHMRRVAEDLAAFMARHGHLVASALALTASQQRAAVEAAEATLRDALANPDHACNAPAAIMPTAGLPNVIKGLRESAAAWDAASEAWGDLTALVEDDA